MAMNRAQKRMLQKQGALGADGEPTRERPSRPARRRRRRSSASRPGEAHRPVQFLREVRAELRKVAWPTRPEVINYSIIVLVAIVVLTTFIAIVDYGASEFVLKLFDD